MGSLESQLTKNISVFSLFAILLLSVPYTSIPIFADPPLPDPGPILPKVFCIRIMDIREISPGIFDIEFEFLNWSNTAIHKIELDIVNPNLGNVEFAGSSIDADDRPLIFEDLDNDGMFPPADLDDFEDLNNNGILDQGEDLNANGRLDNDPAPGNLTPVNDWTTGTLTPTELVFVAGTPIPFLDLLGASTTTAANDLIPGWPQTTNIDVNGEVDPPEAIDNGPNVLGGFVIRVSGLDDGEIFSMNWMTFDSNGDLIGSTQGGNSFGFGMISFSYLANPGPQPGSPFLGFPPMAQSPRDFYDSVFKVASEAGTQMVPQRWSFPYGPGCIECNPRPDRIFNAVPFGVPLDGHVIFSTPACFSGGCEHFDFTKHFAEGNFGLFRHHDGIGHVISLFFFDQFQPGPSMGTSDLDLKVANAGTFSVSQPTGGPFGGPIEYNGTIDMLDGTGTVDVTMDDLPQPNTQIVIRSVIDSPPILNSVEMWPDQTPGFTAGDAFRITYSLPTDMANFGNFNDQYDVIRVDTDQEVSIGPGSVNVNWENDRTVHVEFLDVSGATWTGEPGDHYLLPNPNTTIMSADGLLSASQFFGSGAIAGFDVGPEPIILCLINTTHGEDTIIDKDCLLGSNTLAGGNVHVLNPFVMNLPSGIVLGVDFDLYHLMVEAGAGVHLENSSTIADDEIYIVLVP